MIESIALLPTRSFSRSTLLWAIALSSIQCSLMDPLDGYAGGTPGGAAGFETRCRAPGVIRCYGFDDDADLAKRYEPPASGARADIDRAQKTFRAGKPYEQWIDAPKFTLHAEGDSVAGFDSVYLTSKNAGGDHPTAYAWYDELIVSTEPIAVPAVAP